MQRIMCNEFTKWGLSRMKNRDRYILKVNEYDMLLQFQHNIMDCGCTCVLDGLTGEVHNCPYEMRFTYGEQARLDLCSKCIQDFLNEES